jgi:biotin carboxyl carrier protein
MDCYRITLDGETFDVEILSDPTREEIEVRVDGETLRVRVGNAMPQELASTESPIPEVAPTTPQPVSSRPTAAPTANGSQLVSPLPGTIIAVSVQAGQHVDTGDELLIIEAMKMNNRIRSPRTGTVGEVLVQVGQQVNHGVPLLAWLD